MYSFPPDLWAPQRRGLELTINALSADKAVCLYAPTGGGKSRLAIELFNWAASRRETGSFYVNRKLLIGQTADKFKAAKVPFGIRAADYEDSYDFSAPFQICSADTERSRVYQRKIWQPHDADLVIVDEAHLMKTGVMKQVLDEARARNAKIVLLTATPIGLSGWADELVVSGSLSEYRACKALVPAVVRSIEQPDLSKVKRSVTGEYVLDGKKRQIYTQSIVGSVIDRWKRYNPNARPTMLYAPGVAESIWLTEQFMKAGVNWCHVDATDAIIDGKRATLTRALWKDEILPRYISGSIKGLSCRFRLREGIDVPSTYHVILATPIGSLASYIQTVGRVLRYSPETPDQVLITDHGGNFLRHGSPNHDRDWAGWWNIPEGAVSEINTNNIRDGKQPEPIRCPKCEGERLRGPKCPHCGFEHVKSQRIVIQEDGKMVIRDGHLIKPRVERRKPDTASEWEKLYWGWSKKKLKKNWNQMIGYFHHKNGYRPPKDLPFMPKDPTDWYGYVHTVSREKLIPKPVQAG